MVATARIAATPQIIPSYSSGGATMYPHFAFCTWFFVPPLERHLDRFSVFARFTAVCPTYRHKNYGTCNICSNRTYLCDACNGA